MKPEGLSATTELISAMCALNQYDARFPITMGSKYISEEIPEVKHAMEHIRSALDVVSEMEHKIRELETSQHQLIYTHIMDMKDKAYEDRIAYLENIINNEGYL